MISLVHKEESGSDEGTDAENEEDSSAMSGSAANDEEDNNSDSPEDRGGDRSVLVGVIVATVLLILFIGAGVTTVIMATVVWYVRSRFIITELVMVIMHCVFAVLCMI